MFLLFFTKVASSVTRTRIHNNIPCAYNILYCWLSATVINHAPDHLGNLLGRPALQAICCRTERKTRCPRWRGHVDETRAGNSIAVSVCTLSPLYRPSIIVCSGPYYSTSFCVCVRVSIARG